MIRRRGGLAATCTSPILLMLGVAAGVVLAPARASGSESFLTHGNTRVGVVSLEQEIGHEVVRTREVATLALRGAGRERVRIDRASVETLSGVPISWEERMLAGSARTSTRLEARGDQVRVAQRRGSSVTRSLRRAPDWKLAHGVALLIESQRGDAAFAQFDSARDAFRTVRVSSVPGATTVASPLQGSAGPARAWNPAARRLAPNWSIWGLVLSESPCAGRCDRTQIVPLDLLAGAVVRSPYRIPRSASRRAIRYVFAYRDPGPLAPRFPVTSEQDVVVRGARTVVTVCDACGTESVPTAEALARYRSANDWVESRHPLIRGISTRAARVGSSHQRMLQLAEAVRRHMRGRIDYAGYATAAEAAESRSGDCTEFALLLAAVARARGLPARVVAGLAYSSRFTGRSHVFSPHAWVQVWDGRRWSSYDAGLDGFDATHIAIDFGDGSPQAFRGVMRLIRRIELVDAGVIDRKPEDS